MHPSQQHLQQQQQQLERPVQQQPQQQQRLQPQHPEPHHQQVMAASASASTPQPMPASAGTTPAMEAQALQEEDFDEEWEEWDGNSPFLHHCIAGSLAGVAEHVMVYPLDTVRTHIQVCAACVDHSIPGKPNVSVASSSAIKQECQTAVSKASAASGGGSSVARAASNAAASGRHHPMANYGMWQTMRYLVSQPIIVDNASSATATSTSTAARAASAEVAASVHQQIMGIRRLWRGVQTILIGCIPAHALYFSAYEVVKAATLDPKTHEATAYGSALAGAAATLGHDVILAPLDTVKQRLQLGHYRGLSHALQTMVQNEGWSSLFRSFPVTFATNVPYGMVMVGTNEFLKQQWTNSDGHPKPLTLPVTMGASAVAGFTAAATTTPLDRIKTFLQTQQLSPVCSIGVPPEACPMKSSTPLVTGWQQAARRIYLNEGLAGFFRGMTPRVLSHTPAVAISWTTYETAKQYLRTLE